VADWYQAKGFYNFGDRIVSRGEVVIPTARELRRVGEGLRKLTPEQREEFARQHPRRAAALRAEEEGRRDVEQPEHDRSMHGKSSARRRGTAPDETLGAEG